MSSNKPNTMRRFVVVQNGQQTAEGVRYTGGLVALFWLQAEHVTLWDTIVTLRKEIGNTGEVVYVDPDPACPYCNGWGVSDNYHCHCYGPAADQTPGNLAIRLRVEAEHGM